MVADVLATQGAMTPCHGNKLRLYWPFVWGIYRSSNISNMSAILFKPQYVKHVASKWYAIEVSLNEGHCVSNHRWFDCLFNSLSRQQRKHQSPILLALCESNLPVTGRVSSQGPATREPFPCHDVIILKPFKCWPPLSFLPDIHALFPIFVRLALMARFWGNHVNAPVPQA